MTCEPHVLLYADETKHICAVISLSDDFFFHSLLTGFGLVELCELGKTTTFVSQHHHLQRTSSNAVNRCFCGLIYNISRWKSIVLLHPYTMQRTAGGSSETNCSLWLIPMMFGPLSFHKLEARQQWPDDWLTSGLYPAPFLSLLQPTGMTKMWICGYWSEC